MKNVFKRLLNAFGFELRRNNSNPGSLRPHEHLPGSMAGGHIVEFVGMQGAGKTFLMRHCMGHLKADFISGAQALRFMGHRDGAKNSREEIHDFYRCLSAIRIEKIVQEMRSANDARNHLKRIRSLSQASLKNIAIEERFPSNIVLDEGVCKNFTEATLILARSGHVGALEVLSRRSLIFVIADPATTEAQLRNRQVRKGVANNLVKPDLLPGMPIDQAVQYFADWNVRYQNWIKELEPYTRGVLYVRREDVLKKNIAAVIDFVSRQISEGLSKGSR